MAEDPQQDTPTLADAYRQWTGHEPPVVGPDDEARADELLAQARADRERVYGTAAA